MLQELKDAWKEDPKLCVATFGGAVVMVIGLVVLTMIAFTM